MSPSTATLKDLSFALTGGGAAGGIFSLVDHCNTAAGREALRQLIAHPPPVYAALQQRSEAVRWWYHHTDRFTTGISNGTIVLLDKFFEASDTASVPPAGISAILGSFLQRIFNKAQYTFVQFSLTHLADLLRGCRQLVSILEEESLPEYLRRDLSAMQDDLSHPLIPMIEDIRKDTPYAELARLSYRARRELKSITLRLIAAYAHQDGLHSLAHATRVNGWTFPQILPDSDVLTLNAGGLYHPLIPSPKPYDISLGSPQHFLFLTGANMSGKTTMLRALGVAALLAGVGSGVPAKSFTMSFLHGIVTNMHVEDNILRGESYFYAEVQRMKETALRLRDAKGAHLVLMDELFKGTNVHDAYECTRAVVSGLLNYPQHLLLLSTHLHEVADHFAGAEAMRFACFVTHTAPDGSFRFTYELRDGVSADRIGYRILQQEGVIDILNRGKS